MIIIIIANLVIGGLIGISGIGGFFLPVIYSTVLSMNISDSLMLSFSAFLVSGIVGTISYTKLGYIKYKFALILGVGCWLGAVTGVNLSAFVSASFMKILLYIMVLFAGVSLLIAKKEKAKQSKLLENNALLIILGVMAGIICSMSGAGGALILVPVLAALGMPIKNAVGISILESIFIAIPSSLGYFVKSSLDNVWMILLLALLFHGLGVIAGSRLTKSIDQNLLKRSIGILSVIVAIYMLIKVI